MLSRDESLAHKSITSLIMLDALEDELPPADTVLKANEGRIVQSDVRKRTFLRKSELQRDEGRENE